MAFWFGTQTTPFASFTTETVGDSKKLLDTPVQDYRWLDLDDDGKVNDVLVVKKG